MSTFPRPKTIAEFMVNNTVWESDCSGEQRFDFPILTLAGTMEQSHNEFVGVVSLNLLAEHPITIYAEEVGGSCPAVTQVHMLNVAKFLAAKVMNALEPDAYSQLYILPLTFGESVAVNIAKSWDYDSETKQKFQFELLVGSARSYPDNTAFSSILLMLEKPEFLEVDTCKFVGTDTVQSKAEAWIKKAVAVALQSIFVAF